MRVGSSALALLLCLAFPTRAQTPQEEARRVIVETVADVEAVLHNAQLSQTEKQKRIEAIADARFDYDRMSKLVLARNLQKLSEAQRQEFITEFRRHLSATYGRRIGTYTSEKIEVGEARLEGNGDVTVKSRITGGAAGSGVEIDYRMKPRDGNWYAIDVIIEGVSLLQNFRAQVQEIVNTSGVDQLIAMLRTRNERKEAERPQ